MCVIARTADPLSSKYRKGSWRSISNAYSEQRYESKNPSKKPAKVFIIAGPTASGKTAFAIDLAKRINGEIVSCDSMQIYQGLDITTAKPTKAELEAVPHHLIGVISPDRAFSVADYIPLAERMIDDIVKRGKVPILAGGTGLYIKSLRDGIGFDSTGRDDTVRECLTLEAQTLGIEAMWKRLYDCDPESAELIPPQNMVRIIRALEVFETTGIPFSSYRREAQKGNDKYHFRGIYLDFPDRAQLYSRINNRVDNMIETGMVDECKTMYDTVTEQHMNLMNIALAIGYKELIPYFDGETTLEAAIETIKQSTRRYAKRQLTWFRHDEKLTRMEVNYNDSADNKKNFNKIYEFFSKQ